MSVTDAEFKQWLGRVCSDNAQYVVNIKDVGANRPNDVYVGRHKGALTDWGNPFEVADHGRFGAIKRYVIWLGQLGAEARLEYLTPIRKALAEGKQLACYCAPLACHAHVLAGWAMTLGADTPEGEPGRERSEPALPSGSPTRATTGATKGGPRFASKR